MKLEDFTPGVAKKVILLWKRHLGFYHRENSYLRHPEILADFVHDPTCWLTGGYQDRIGSRYTDDSKLLILNSFG